MVQLKNKEALEGIRASCRLLASLHSQLGGFVEPGKSTKEIDSFIHDFIKDHGGIPGFLGYMGFPASSCISVNEEVIHGIPGKRVITSRDIISIDIGI